MRLTSLQSRTAKDGSGLLRSTSAQTPEKEKSCGRSAAANGRGVAPTSASVSIPFGSGDSGARGSAAVLAPHADAGAGDAPGVHVAAAPGGVQAGECHACALHSGAAFSSARATASRAA